MKYIIITPIKNEEEFIRSTLESVVNQNIKPEEWIIIDDNSLDNTWKIISDYTIKYPWIKLYKNPSSEEENRSGGSKIVNLFNIGLQKIKISNYEIIVKLDADLALPKEYFSSIINNFKNNPQVALCGGYCLIPSGDGSWIREHNNPDHVRGAFKAYRKEAFIEMGGLRPIWNWDGIDEMILRQKGYNIETLELPVKHFRPTSAAYNPYKHSYKSGQEVYRMRYGSIIMIGKSISLMKDKPYLIKGLCFISGYISSLLNRDKPILKSDLSKFIRRYYYNRIFGK